MQGPTPFDLVVRNARLRDRPGTWSVGVSGDRIAAITDEPVEAVQTLDAEGALVTESFVNAHLHLDKVYTLDRVGDEALSAYTQGSMGGAMTAIELAAAVKEQYDEGWIYPNARRAVLEGIRHGVRHVLAFADVDTKAQLRGVRPLLRLREEFRGVVDLQVVAFPQDGLLRNPGAEELVREAVGLGADVVGGIPWLEYDDVDAAEHVRRMCALAASTGRRVAMLVDDAGDPTLRTTEMLALAMLDQGLQGRGVANHARAMALYPEPSVRRLAGLAAKAGLGFVTDPHTGPLHLRVDLLRQAGVPVALGQDDIEDAYYPFGRHNLLEVAFVSAHILEAVTSEALGRLYDMVTTTAARVLGVPDHRLELGGPADLVVLDGRGVRDAIGRHAPPRYVIASGRLVAVSESHTTFPTLDEKG
jgi:cytosine deaminase